MLLLVAPEVVQPDLPALAAATTRVRRTATPSRRTSGSTTVARSRSRPRVPQRDLRETSTATQGLLDRHRRGPATGAGGLWPAADVLFETHSTGVVLPQLAHRRSASAPLDPGRVPQMRVDFADVPAPSTLPHRRTVRPYLDALVARATSRTPSARPADARLLVTEVRRVQSALRDGRGTTRRCSTTCVPRPGDSAPRGRRSPADYDATQLVPTRCPARPPCSRHPHPRRSPARRCAPSERRDDDRIADSATAGPPAAPRPVAVLLVLPLTTGMAVAGWYLTTGRFISTRALTSLAQVQAEPVADGAAWPSSSPRTSASRCRVERSSRRPVGRQQDPEGRPDDGDGPPRPRALRHDRLASPARPPRPRRAGEPEPGRCQREVQRHRTGRDRAERSEKPRAAQAQYRFRPRGLQGPRAIPVEDYLEGIVRAAAGLRKAGFNVVTSGSTPHGGQGPGAGAGPKSGQGERGDPSH